MRRLMDPRSNGTLKESKIPHFVGTFRATQTEIWTSKVGLKYWLESSHGCRSQSSPVIAGKTKALWLI
jgi:hypothetical protein